MRDGDLANTALLRPVREWLADRATAPEPAAGSRRSTPAELSRNDPAAAWSARTVRGRFGYALSILIDAPNNVALDVAASPARFAAEVDAGRDMLARTAERFGYRPKRVAADTAYGSAAFLAFVRDQGARYRTSPFSNDPNRPRASSRRPLSPMTGSGTATLAQPGRG